MSKYLCHAGAGAEHPAVLGERDDLDLHRRAAQRVDELAHGVAHHDDVVAPIDCDSSMTSVIGPPQRLRQRRTTANRPCSCEAMSSRVVPPAVMLIWLRPPPAPATAPPPSIVTMTRLASFHCDGSASGPAGVGPGDRVRRERLTDADHPRRARHAGHERDRLPIVVERRPGQVAEDDTSCCTSRTLEDRDRRWRPSVRAEHSTRHSSYVMPSALGVKWYDTLVQKPFAVRVASTCPRHHHHVRSATEIDADRAHQVAHTAWRCRLGDDLVGRCEVGRHPQPDALLGAGHVEPALGAALLTQRHDDRARQHRDDQPHDRRRRRAARAGSSRDRASRRDGHAGMRGQTSDFTTWIVRQTRGSDS